MTEISERCGRPTTHRASPAVAFALSLLAVASAWCPGAEEPATTAVKGKAANHALSVGVPAKWKSDAKEAGAGWVGVWLSADGVELFLSASPHAQKTPLPLEKAADALLPQLIQKHCPWLKPGKDRLSGDYHGYPYSGRSLSGEKDKAAQAGTAVIVDAGPVTLFAITFGPEKPVAAALPLTEEGLKQLTIDGVAGPFGYPAAKATTKRPAGKAADAPAGK